MCVWEGCSTLAVLTSGPFDHSHVDKLLFEVNAQRAIRFSQVELVDLRLDWRQKYRVLTDSSNLTLGGCLPVAAFNLGRIALL